MKKPKLKRKNPTTGLDAEALAQCVGSLMVDQALKGASMIERVYVVSRIPGLLKEFREREARPARKG